ncbi:MAG: AMMECR1 domain-containing protein [Alphaproteobacteria bacterium]
MEEKIKKSKSNIVIIIIIASLFVYINYHNFSNSVSSNSKDLVNYKQNIDEMFNYREPKVALLLYENNNKFQKPSLIISTSENYLDFLYEKHGQNDKSIKTLILNPMENEKKIETIITENNLIPKAIELNSENLDNYVVFYNKNDYITNINNFIKDYNQELNNIIEQSFFEEIKPLRVSKKDYPLSLFDKGNSFVSDGKIEVGSLNANIGIAQDIANNIFHAKKQGLNEHNFTVEILTKIQPITYTSQDELYNQITKKTNGVALRDGYRQAVFLPKMWNKYKTKEEFIKELKLKAKLSPDYNSNKIKFYKFESVVLSGNKNQRDNTN